MRIKIFVILLVGIIVLLLGTVGILLYQAKSQQNTKTETKTASISGKFNINGIIPEGASITLTQKQIGKTGATQKIFASNLPVADQSLWSFNTAQENEEYEIQAQVVVGQNIVASSDVLFVTAPADDETLTVNIESEKHTPNAVISGNIIINGYIPNGATITIKGRKLGAQQFTTVTQNLPAASRQFMNYTTALSGTTYEVEGILLTSTGTVIGTSNIITLTAPAGNEELIINSSSQPPLTPTPTPSTQTTVATPTPIPQGAAISGGINLNGAVPANSRIVIFQQTQNNPSYQVAVNNVSPMDGATWSWGSAQNGTWYTLIAVLKQHNADGTDTDIATSSPITVAAPASNVIFTLNSTVSLSSPGGPISVSCQTYNGGPNQNTWNVAITFQSIPGAQSYWYQVGSTSGSNNLVNTANQSNTITATFSNNTTYYARYAYTNVPSTPLGSPQWSGFSSSTPLQCSH
ncbi:MAG TPA: hypothetical protein PKA38_00350 [Candidatus Levybacteria bacterium]|nr:hypothetical protein [Candidatus Levybacteria bacterium]